MPKADAGIFKTNMHTKERLKELQALPLIRKVGFSAARGAEFWHKTGHKAYVSLSKGKDSLVLLHIMRGIIPEIPAVFCDTGLEYPEVKNLEVENVTVVRPSVSFKEVIEKHGFPVISKAVARTINEARRGLPLAIQKMNGTFLNNMGNISTSYNYSKYLSLMTEPFKISHNCCNELKKKPLLKFGRDNGGLRPIIGTMAHESKMRKNEWVRSGCNSFSAGKEISRPLSFWTEQDILEYIQLKKIKIPSVYGTISGEQGKLKLSGVSRTGCIFCLFGLNHDGPRDRFHRLAESHPMLYKYCIETLGLGPVVEAVRALKRKKEDLLW